MDFTIFWNRFFRYLHDRGSVLLSSGTSNVIGGTRKDMVKTINKKSNEKMVPARSNPFVLRESYCDDLNESSGTDGEDEDTDLSGFIVDDDVDLSFYGSADELSPDSELDRRNRTRQRTVVKPNSRRRLVRGSRNVESGRRKDTDTALSKAFDSMSLGVGALEDDRNASRTKTLEVVDLMSSPVTRAVAQELDEESEQDETPEQSSEHPFSKVGALRPNPTTLIRGDQPLPSKSRTQPSDHEHQTKQEETAERPVTPPATPSKSPSKSLLRSPTKLLSPSKRTVQAPNFLHRQSIDAFWDHNTVNEWHDTNSPKRAPLLSPRKNPLARFVLEAHDDIEEPSDADHSQPTTTSQDAFDDSTDSLPSPSESPSKSRSPSKVSALKSEQARIREEKKARLAAKKAFDSTKEGLALSLLQALDQYVTESKITTMSASTGGIKVIWSKTLRSTAGRANWKRTITKPSGSPIKGDPNSTSVERQQGVVVQHFASIELAEKIIDRPERLVNTLAHEFCHLANFMVSGVRDQPHGESFKHWGKKVTSWLRSPNAKQAPGWQAEWSLAEVTTKHSYVVETKYLWVCTGRPANKQKQTLTMKMLDIEAEDEEGCGAEYGRHSKSIDVEKQRCGRCKGFLVQVRPTPRAAASPKKSPFKKRVASKESGVTSLEKLVEVIELSD
ncbi:hypothetical protein LTR64_001421 [Lithohypha guttulata]|uniref:uncharacterized protein n=1 Tax=Lithohypha guttulata TaxID=1690604 RepID=UPI002DE063BD|nr:hypothetical protein LTR51_003615 [Lithohypha guttulata]